MNTGRSASRDRNLLRAVELYYRDGLTQAAIAERLGCTRWTVGRLIKEASDKGIVTIYVHHPHARNVGLESQICAVFGLDEARVIPTQDTSASTLALIARSAADYLADIRPLPRSVAVAPGRTIAAVAHALADVRTRPTDVFMAHPTPALPDASVIDRAVSRYARKSGGAIHSLEVPLVVPSADEAEIVKNASETKRILTEAENAEVLAFSVASGVSRTWLVAVGASTAGAAAENLSGAAGMVLGHWVNADGTLADLELDDRSIAISLERAKDIRKKVLVAGGKGKVSAIAAACSLGLVNTLITDSETAEMLLAA